MGETQLQRYIPRHFKHNSMSQLSQTEWPSALKDEDAQYVRHSLPVSIELPKSSRAASMDCHNGTADRSKQQVSIARFLFTQDQLTTSICRPLKRLLDLDLNEPPQLPTVLTILSPTSTIGSGDSANEVVTDESSMPTERSNDSMADAVMLPTPLSSTRIREEGTVQQGALSVDLGLLQASEVGETHGGPTDGSKHLNRSKGAPQLDDPRDPEEVASAIRLNSKHGTPAHKKLKTASNSFTVGGYGTLMVELRSPNDPAECSRYVSRRTYDSETVHSRRDCKKVDGKNEDDVSGAVCALVMLLKERRRNFSFLAPFRHLSPPPLYSVEPVKDEVGRESGTAIQSSRESPSDASGSSLNSILFRPSNKQRYRFMAELMTQTPTLSPS